MTQGFGRPIVLRPSLDRRRVSLAPGAEGLPRAARSLSGRERHAATRAVAGGLSNANLPDLATAFAQSGAPILLTHGRSDQLAHVAMSERMLQLQPAARVSIYANAAPAALVDSRRRFGNELARFVYGPQGSRRG